jgi:hypothetical protein
MSEVSLPEANPYHITPTMVRYSYLAFCLMIFVPLAYGLWFYLWGIPLSWGGIGIGALGWTIALLLRNPVALLARAIPSVSKHVTTIVVASSGPCEELVRLGVVLLLGPAFPLALSIGLGWAAIEVVYAIINGFVTLSLFRRDDEKARQARSVLENMGLAKAMLNTPPFMGVVERIFASAIQIGFTLLLAWQPLLVILTIPLHSSINFIALILVRRSVVLAELCLALIGTVILLAGLGVFGRL